jgi:hypothetical protein
MNKNFSTTVKAVGSEGDRTLEFIGTTELEDRDGDVMVTSGGDFTNYMKNPVFLAMHNFESLPVGRTLKVIPDLIGKKTSFVVKFPTIEELSSNPQTPSEHALFADTVYRMYKGGYLNAVSIGFNGIEFEPRKANNGRPYAQLYKKYELLEISAVPIPANADALRRAKAAGVLNAKTAKFFEVDIDDITPEQFRAMLSDKFKSVLKPKEFDLSKIEFPKKKNDGPFVLSSGEEITKKQLHEMIKDGLREQGFYEMLEDLERRVNGL